MLFLFRWNTENAHENNLRFYLASEYHISPENCRYASRLSSLRNIARKKK